LSHALAAAASPWPRPSPGPSSATPLQLPRAPGHGMAASASSSSPPPFFGLLVAGPLIYSGTPSQFHGTPLPNGTLRNAMPSSTGLAHGLPPSPFPLPASIGGLRGQWELVFGPVWAAKLPDGPQKRPRAHASASSAYRSSAHRGVVFRCVGGVSCLAGPAEP
jgi:hypothetical protein